MTIQQEKESNVIFVKKLIYMPSSPNSDTPVSPLHPYNIFMVLFLAGISMLFLAFSISYVYTRIEMNIPPVKLPTIFFFNTLILLTSSYTMNMAKKAYLNDDTEQYQRTLIYTIILSILFMVAQAFGWGELFRNNISLTHSNTASYLYVISGLHFAHVLVGLPFLILFFYTARKRMKEPVSVLVYFSDPEKRLKLKLLTIYWHFLDILWIYLVVFFIVNYWIQ